MKTTLLLIRHGQTDWNVTRRWQGHTDTPLNATGQAQAVALANRLASWPIQTIYSSDLQRCTMTVQPLADATDLEPILDPIWRERDVGEFSGLTGEQARSRFPEVWANGNLGMIDPPNGEKYLDLRARSWSAYEKVVANHPGEMVAIVTHGGVLHTLIGQLIGLDVSRYGRFSMRGNTGLSIVEVNAHGPFLTLLNDTSHLETGN
jgi:probable phosphoglycerate mutase